MKKTIVMMLLLALIIPSFLLATDATEKTYFYDRGNTHLNFKAGVSFPLFFIFPGQDPAIVSGMGSGDGATHLKLGGYGAIGYQAFLSPLFSIGGELGYGFSYSLSDSLLTLVPIQFKATYMPVQGTIDVPISLGAGFAYTKYETSSYFAPMLSADVGALYYFSENWGVGLNLSYWFIMEIYGGNNAGQTAFANFLPITIAVTYRN